MSSQAISQIKKRIAEVKKSDPNVVQLDLSQIEFQKFTPAINALLEKLPGLEVLHLGACNLRNLQNFPKLPKLVAIDLSKNSLNDTVDFTPLLACPDLTQLIIAENKIEKLQTVLKLGPLTKLVQIDLEGNQVSQLAEFRQKMFEKFEVMEYVNRKDKDGNPEPEEQGQEEYDDQEDDQEEYEEDDDQDQFEEDDYDQEEQQSDRPKRGGRKKK